jgi:hypothetical protein
VTGAIVTALLIAGSATSAQADNNGPVAWGNAGPAGATAGAGASASPVATAGSSGAPTTGGSSGCAQGYTYVGWASAGGGQFAIGNGAGISVTAGQPATALGGQMVPAGTTSVTDVYCGGTWVTTVFGGPPGAGPVVQVNPLALAQQALASAAYQPLQIHTDPPSGRLVVNFPVWLSLSSGFAPVSASASVGPVTSTVSVTPVSVAWSMGDGGGVTCQGPGVPYDPARPFDQQVPPSCGYQYGTSSAGQPGQQFTVTATVRYQATWTVTGAPGGGSLGPVDRSVSVPVTVGQIEAVS